MGTPPIEATSWWQAMMTWMGLIVAPEQTDALPVIDRVAMGTKDCGRWALYGSSEVAGVSATGGQVAGVLVAGGSVLALSTVMEVSWHRFPSCGNCSRALTSMCTWLLR